MNELPIDQQSEPDRSGGYSLSSLFLLIALVAVVSAHISPLLNASSGSDRPPDPLMLTVVYSVSGAILGVIVGLHHYRRLRGVLLGFLLGVTFGALSGPVVAAATLFPQHTLLISIGSAAILLALAAFFRRLNDDDPVSNRDVYEAKLRSWRRGSLT